MTISDRDKRIIDVLKDYMQCDRSISLARSAGETDKCDTDRYQKAERIVMEIEKEGKDK